MTTARPRTGFQFDLVPWKLVFCDLGAMSCEGRGELFYIDDLPEAPEPGRIPREADHLHIITKMSGERDAREEEKWRALLWGTARCDHGRLPGDSCRGCRGYAPSMEGARIGTAADKRAIIIPPREEMQEILKWLR